MKKIWQARKLVMSGYSVTEIVKVTGMSSSAIYMYTKSERSRVKQRV